MGGPHAKSNMNPNMRELLHLQPLLSTDHEGQALDIAHANPDSFPAVLTRPEIAIRKFKALKQKSDVRSDAPGKKRRARKDAKSAARGKESQSTFFSEQDKD